MLSATYRQEHYNFDYLIIHIVYNTVVMLII
jgi:hypothetical protein